MNTDLSHEYVCSLCGYAQERYGVDSADYYRCHDCGRLTWHHRRG